MGYIPETVISTMGGLPVDSSYFNRLFKQALCDSKIENNNYDILRNTFAARCFKNGFSSIEVNRFLGYTASSKRLHKLERMVENKSE
jgi:hypothetical protein